MSSHCIAAAVLFQPGSPEITPAALAHLYVSTLTYIMAPNLVWALWSVIQSATAEYSTAEHPSWTKQPDGEAFRTPPLAYLEYAEQRMELYDQMKNLWLAANACADEYPSPPQWQNFTSDADWQKWIRKLEPMHTQIAQIELQSAQRHAKAFQQYQAAAAKAKASS